MDFRDKNVQNILLGIIVLLALIPVVWERAMPSAPKVKKSVTVASAAKAGKRLKRKGIEEHAARTITFAGAVLPTVEGFTEEFVVEDAPEGIGARYAEMRLTNNRYLIRVVLLTETRCMEGDYDIIREDVRHARNKRLLLTLEPLGPEMGAFEPIVHEISVGDISGGKTFRFALPPQERSQHAGVFLCLDSQKTGRCRNKPVENLAKVSQRYVRQALPKKNRDKPLPVARDKTYFFHYFLFDGGNLVGFDSLMDEDKYPVMDRYLADRTGDGGVTSEVVSRVRYLATTLRSMPVYISQHSVLLNLPRHDEGLCDAKGVKLPIELKRALEKRGGRVTRRPR